MEDLQDKLALHNGSEGVVAQTAAWMAWNLASKIIEEQLNSPMEKTIERNTHGEFNVYQFDTYPNDSVLAGQTRKQFLDMYDTVELAKKDYPDATEGYRDAHNHFDHLPDY
jgi:hypothetical protein